MKLKIKIFAAMLLLCCFVFAAAQNENWPFEGYGAKYNTEKVTHDFANRMINDIVYVLNVFKGQNSWLDKDGAFQIPPDFETAREDFLRLQTHILPERLYYGQDFFYIEDVIPVKHFDDESEVYNIAFLGKSTNAVLADPSIGGDVKKALLAIGRGNKMPDAQYTAIIEVKEKLIVFALDPDHP